MRRDRYIWIGTFVGLFVGVSFSAWVLYMMNLHGGSEDYMWLLDPLFVVLWLPSHLCHLVGVDWPIGGHYFSSSIRLIYATNSVALGLAGALWGFLLRITRAKKDVNVP
jgi:hypothetical protein